MVLETLLKFMDSYKLGDFASILGLIISLFGFGVTIFAVFRSKEAAERAAAVVETVRKDLRKSETVADFASALAVMAEIKRLHRQHSLQLLPDRYSSLRKSLISIRSSNPILTDSDKKIIQSSITQFSSIELRIDEHLLKNASTDLNFSKINGIVSKQIDKIQEVLIRLRTEIGEHT